jgi:hypothetical protein
MWSDESMTAMQGSRVLRFGYPKVHDGTNVLYDFEHSDPTLGIDASTDAFIGGTSWGHYYFVAPFVALAGRVDGLYAKTAILRIPFACAGTAGLVLLFLAVSAAFPRPTEKLAAICAYILMTTASVPLLLHMREVRYYSLTLLVFGGIVLLFSRHRIWGQGRGRVYLPALAALLLLLFFTFAPAYFVMVAAVALAETALALRDRSGAARFMTYLAPLAASSLLLIPAFVFFRTFSLSSAIAAYHHASYVRNLRTLLGFFFGREMLAGALVLVAAAAVVRRRRGDRAAASSPDVAMTAFLLIVLVVYAALISRIGVSFLFTRYFIVLQPVVSLLVLLGGRMLLAPDAPGGRTPRARLIAVSALVAAFFTLDLVRNADLLEGKLDEAVHRYEGPLDAVIPYLAQRYPAPDRLVVAVSYEETSFMYYLGSRTIVGFLGNNLEQDLRLVPDVIVFRRRSPRFEGGTERALLELLRRGGYRRVVLPVYDAKYNTIPEVIPPYVHPFRTQAPKSEGDKLVLYVREPA